MSRPDLGLLLVAGGVLAACATDSPPPATTAASLQLLSQLLVTGTPGWEVDTVVVLALDKAGHPLPGAAITWSAPGDSVTPLATESDSAGYARAIWQLGIPEGTRVLTIGSGHAAAVTVQATSSTLHAVSLTSGDGFNCALDASHKAWCWGANYFGTLGRGFASNTPSDTAVAASGSISFITLSASKSGSVCGLDGGGAAYCWGNNAGGQLGSGAVGDTMLVPTAVATALRFTQISTNGDYYAYVKSCGLTAQGEVWCWGSNRSGQLGDSTLPTGSQDNSLAPVRVQTTEAFTSVKVGFFHSCGINGTGALFCWGQQYGDTGALGARPHGIYPTPIPVAPGYQFIDVAFGNDLTCGLTTAHQAYCWGLNWFGGLGHGDTTMLAPDPLLVAGGHTFQSLANGNFEQIFALGSDGLPYTWGSPECCDVSQNTPLLMDANIQFANIDGQQGPFGACGVDANGAVYCSGWGTRRARGVPVRNGP